MFTGTEGVAITAFGDLMSKLPRARESSSLERFLYGPDVGSPVRVRNAQGMTLAGARLLVCDQGQLTVLHLDMATGRLAGFPRNDPLPQCPVDIACDESGRAYVADTTHKAVLVYDERGRFVEALTPASQAQSFRPSCLEFAGDVLYVGDMDGRCVARYDTTSQDWMDPLSPPEGAGSLAAPAGLAFTADGTLLVADALAGCIHRVSSGGEWLEPIGRPGRGPGEFVRPRQVAVTPSGLVCVADAGRQSVLIFDANGLPIAEIHGSGDFGGWTLPTGLLAIPPEVLRFEVAGEDRMMGPPPAIEELLIVSDELGAVPLSVVGIGREEGRVDQ